MVDHNDSASESDSDTWYWYDATDRSKQLLRLEQDCDLLAQLLDESDPVIASVYRAVAADAKNLNDPPIEHADLKLLVGRVPTKPPWLNPREVSWNMPRTEPMLQFADLRSKLDATMLELRAIATSDLQGSADDGPGKRLHHSSSSEESLKLRLTNCEVRLAKSRGRISPANDSLQTPARYHLDIGLTQFLRGRHDEALTAFRFASQYKALCFSTVSHPTGEPLTLVLPDTGEHVPFAGKPPNHYVGIPEWIDALALSITVRDSISTKSLVSFNDLYLLGVVQRGPTSNAFALPDAWKAVASNDPNARMLVTAAQDVTLHEPFHDHNVAPVLVAMARLCDGDGPGLVAALDEACKKRYRWLTEEPDGETQPGSAGDHKAAVHWPAAALARLGADRGIAQHKPNPYIPDFGPRFMRD